MLALRAGEIGYQRWLVHCTPHFLFSFQKEKRKRAVHGPKEKRKYVPCGGTWDGRRARSADRLVRMSSARGVVRAGALEVVEWTSFAFRCRSCGGYWKTPESLLLRGLFSAWRWA